MNGESGDGPMAELDELLGAYALDAVDAEEAERIEDYLASNPRAAAEVQEHREVATMLAYTGTAAPEGVWERITQELDGGDAPAPVSDLSVLLSRSTGTATSASMTAESAPEVPDAEASSNKVVPFRRRRAATFLLGAAAAAVVAFGAVVLIDGRASAPVDPIAEAYQAVQASTDTLAAEMVAEGSDVVAEGVLAADGQGYVDASALPTLPDGQTYQLWGVLNATGDVVSLGILGAQPGLETFTVDGDIGVAALAITIEESPGVISDGNPNGAYVGTLG